MAKEKFSIVGDELYLDTPSPLGKDLYERQLIMNKETFVKLYEMWIKRSDKPAKPLQTSTDDE